MILITKMGRLFLTLVVGGSAHFAQAEPAANTHINLPQPPPARPPVRRPAEDIEADKEERAARRQDRQQLEVEQKSPPPKSQAAKLRDESVAPRRTRGMMSASLLIPTVKVTQGREDYHAELGAMARGYWRIPEEAQADHWQPYLGMRAAMFSGTGVHDDITGRFSMTYLGPAFCFGRFGAPPQDAGQAGDGDDQALANLAYGGTTIAFGIALQSRAGYTDTGADPQNDFFSRGLTFDSPGLWSEAEYAKIYFGAVQASFLGGIQLGKGKTFFYVGAGLGGRI